MFLVIGHVAARALRDVGILHFGFDSSCIGAANSLCGQFARVSFAKTVTLTIIDFGRFFHAPKFDGHVDGGRNACARGLSVADPEFLLGMAFCFLTGWFIVLFMGVSLFGLIDFGAVVAAPEDFNQVFLLLLRAG